ncbi:MAG: hypothetical protein EPN31_16250 [Castellaniella sp.]|uniref:hypothetical protein n=1 Tax=Castellaniella sp. TaxID=1955812 RepID=UPI00121E15A8|nr:hypothetical protein [Castellaniella sp.]TAN24989.1 MAG: hypothetical protein EPN31_16250 [Castellaniella sp.]
MQSTMEANVIPRLATRTWAVLPCQHERAFGAPLLYVFGEDGEPIETAVSPVDRLNETAPHAAELVGSFVERVDLSAMIAAVTEGIEPGLALALEAFITHKRLQPPHGEAVAVMDPTPGIWHAFRGTSPAFAVARTRNHIGVLVLHRSSNAARLEAAWIDPVTFRADAAAFVTQCAGIGHDELLAGLATEAPSLAVAGVELLTQDGRRALPNAVLGAMLTAIGDRLPQHHQLQARIDRLLDRIAAVEAPVSRDEYQRYATSLASIRQILAVIAERSAVDGVLALDRYANLPSWAAMLQSLVENVGAACSVVEGREIAPEVVLDAIASAAANGASAEAAQLETPAGRLVAGIACLAMHCADVSLVDSTIAGRFRVLAQLLGTSNWVLARPYDHGVLACVMAGW